MNQPEERDIAVRQARPYSVLAPIYDRMMRHVNYRRWAKYIRAILRHERHWPAPTLLDIGCGTGRFLEEMRRLKQAGDGCDPSADMLEIARKRLPEIHFFHCGLPDLATLPGGGYSVITCLYDTMNYLNDPEVFQRALYRIHQQLTQDGLFIFDVVSTAHCKYYFQNYNDGEVFGEKLSYTRKSYFDSGSGKQTNWLRIHTPHGFFEEVHEQQIYDVGMIRQMIAATSGLQIRHLFEDFTFDRANSRSGRIHFVLHKP